MKSVIGSFCILLFTIPFVGKSFAGLPEHDVIAEKREVWFVPTVYIQHYFFYGESTDGTIQTKIELYSSRENQREERELAEAYPDFKIRMYDINLSRIDFNLSEIERDHFAYTPTLSGWYVTKYVKVPRGNVSATADILNSGPGLKIFVSLYRNGHFVEVEPQVDYRYESMTF